MACIKLKTLEQNLQQVEVFDTPKVHLEQYTTPPHIAACCLHTIESVYGDIGGHFVADLGCGSGVLSVGAAMLGANYCMGFDIDADALDIYKRNVEEFEIDNCESIVCDVLQGGVPQRFDKLFDTVVMNPPFGTRQKGVDVKFVECGLRLASTAVYSLHKTSTRKHILSLANGFGVNVKVIAELKYNLPQTYKFHTRNSVDINVDLVRFSFD